MMGYRQGLLQWLGTAGARLDDLLVWLPCRLVSLSLPLVAGWPLPGSRRWWAQVRQSWRDGRPDPSPNAGLSQAAYAHATGVQLGGVNHYAGIVRSKPLLAAGRPLPDHAAVLRMLALSRRLELLWLLAPIGAGILAETVRIITKTLS
jgi:adenosylcobinamide-phosphate synthase